MGGAAFDVVVTARCRRDLARLPEKVLPAVVETLRGGLASDPSRIGKSLRDDLAGYWVCRRGQFRIIYEFEPDRRLVTVHRVQHRRDVYRVR